MFKRCFIALAAILIASCGSSPDAVDTRGAPQMTPLPKGVIGLPDRTAFYQKDKRWAGEKLGGKNGTLAAEGCLVTSAAMALSNLGFATNPSDLNKRLTANGGFTSRGWLIWDGIRKVTNGRARAIFHSEVSDKIIRQCIAGGDYPLVQFYLPNGRSHWAMIVWKSDKGYHMRDPLRRFNKPLIFPHSVDKFKAVRCIGLADA